MKNPCTLALIILSVLLSSCSTGLKPRSVDQFYTSTGVEKYFLSDIPEWANFSQSAGCFRTKGIRYFDLNALMKSYSIKYSEAIQIQASFNEEFLVLKKQPNITLSLKEEEVLFFKASDKVNSKITFFDAPTFKQIHLVWVDEALKSKVQEDRLKNFLQSSVHDNGYPILISACLTKSEVEAKFPNSTVKIISAEMFSIYNTEGERAPNLHINLNAFFKADQRLVLFTQETKKTVEDIKGSYKLSNY
ncbi:MAG: hypothetical protein K2Q18_05065 [Bdellovibrionales bacterium]|nr:hypothetical protein [Bdellovibrionales bacterium]